MQCYRGFFCVEGFDQGLTQVEGHSHRTVKEEWDSCLASKISESTLWTNVVYQLDSPLFYINYIEIFTYVEKPESKKEGYKLQSLYLNLYYQSCLSVLETSYEIWC